VSWDLLIQGDFELGEHGLIDKSGLKPIFIYIFF